MGLVSSLLLIPAVNRFIKFNREINGQWIKYLTALLRLKRKRRVNKTNRIIKHDVWKDSLRDGGVFPFPHEWEYELPAQV